jgi:branched-chain amino acid transport system substrate-binding protein
MPLKHAVVIALLGTLAATAAEAADPFLVGVIAPTSGPVAVVGVRQLAAIQWWQQDVNAKGGIHGRQVELATCDDQGNPETAVTCARDLIGRHALFLLNTSVTGPVRATLPLVKDGPVMIVASPTIEPSPSSFVFQGLPTDLEITRALNAFLAANAVTRLAMIAATDATGEAGVVDAQKVFPPAGVELALTRIDLRANDASIQLAGVMKSNPQALYSSYSGGGAATVVKSYANLGLTVPLIISNANVTDAFIAVIKNDMPPRLLGLGLRSIVPELVSDPRNRARIDYFEKSYAAWKHEPVDQLNHLGLLLADIANAILVNVGDPGNAAAVRTFLEGAPIDSVQTIHYAPDSHIALKAENMAVVEYKGGRWTKADPLR